MMITALYYHVFDQITLYTINKSDYLLNSKFEPRLSVGITEKSAALNQCDLSFTYNFSNNNKNNNKLKLWEISCANLTLAKCTAV